MLKIVAVAIRHNGLTFSLPRPGRHHDVIRLMCRADTLISAADTKNQGFLTSEGQWVSRDEALTIARAAGQVKEIIGGTLTSEDLW